MSDIIQNLHAMSSQDINELAFQRLLHLNERCTLNLISRLTGITRQTLYRWLDTERELDSMNPRDSAWFILLCETSPRVQLLMDRSPMSHPRLAGRLLDESEEQTDG